MRAKFIQRFLPRFKLQNYLFKRLQRESHTELTSRRLYILPTREGVFFSVIVFLLLSGAMNYNNNLLFIFTFLLAGIGIITMYHTHNNLLHIITRATESASVFVGDELIVPIQISLKSNQTKSRYSLVLETDNNISKTSNSTQAQWFDLNSTGNCIINFNIITHERGYLSPPRLTLHSRYPLGLLRAWSNLLLEQQYLVYPQPLSKSEINKIDLSSVEGIGDQGKGYDEFNELREKQINDAYTHVHWKIYARNEVMLVKQYGGIQSEHIELKWSDFQQFDTEKRLSIFTRILLDAYQQQQLFSLELPNKTISLGSGNSHLHHCLKALALFPKSQPD